MAQYGAKPKAVAITFDDGPDPSFTPKVLDVLKAKGVKATFFLIGAQAQKEPGITRRVYREGHEIGNHTFYHPDISNISKQYMKLELNMTERLFAAKLGVKPVLFRPPYSIDQEPDTADQVRPLEIVQDMGYITVGDKIDPSDWKDNPHRRRSRSPTTCWRTCRPARRPTGSIAATSSCCTMAAATAPRPSRPCP